MKWKLSQFFTPNFWSDFFTKKRWHLFFKKIARISLMSFRGFSDDGCSEKASALTFYSLLSIIPVLAVAFGIAKGFGFEKHLEAEITQRFSEQPEIANKLISFAYNTLQNTQSGLIAGVGLIVLFWSVIKLLSNIENSFNAIWKVKHSRSLYRQFSDYLAMMVFCPIFFAASSSLSVFISTQLIKMSHTYGVWETLSPYILLSFHIFPLILAWLLFTALYYIMPNTKIPFLCALIAGIIGGSSYQIVQWVYIQFQLGLASYGAIYGSFAALPLFLIWLNTSWLIALAGAEIAYHMENETTMSSYSNEPNHRQVEARLLGLLLMHYSVRSFAAGKIPPTIYSFAMNTGVAVVFIRHIVHQLLEAGLLVEVTWKDGTSGYYQPALDLKRISIKSVCDALDDSRHEKYQVLYDANVEQYESTLRKFDDLLDKASINHTFAEET